MVSGELSGCAGRIERLAPTVRDFDPVRWLSPQEVKDLFGLGVDVATLTRMVAKGELASNGERGPGRMKVDIATVLRTLMGDPERLKPRYPDARYRGHAFHLKCRVQELRELSREQAARIKQLEDQLLRVQQGFATPQAKRA
jgi:hypothetical protein